MKINHILSVEILRDGGSLVVSFQSNDSCEYWLVMPIETVEGKTIGYVSPLLVNKTTNLEVELSWSSTHAWLNRLSVLTQNNEQKSLVSKMLDIVNEKHK